MPDKLKHCVVATAIIENNGKYLIIKRKKEDKLFGNRWCFPGGKVDHIDYEKSNKTTDYHWHGIIEKTLSRECKEEVGIELDRFEYLKSIAFLRSDGTPTVVLSYLTQVNSTDVKIDRNELADYSWVSLSDAKNYRLIPGIYSELELADKKLFSRKYRCLFELAF